MSADELRQLIVAELDRPAGPEAEAIAARFRSRPGVAAVLFYGAWLRDRGGEGPLDLYVLTDSNIAYHGIGVSALANRLLPPNVYHEVAEGPPRVEAKVAVVTLKAFCARMRPEAIDTTFWARFAQPVALLWARSPADRERVVSALTRAVETAAWWAARFAPATAVPEEAWQALFTHTYGSELRVEGGQRARDLVAVAPERYLRLHTLLIEGAPVADRDAALRAWRRRRQIGKVRNVARLMKAAFTYQGGLAYALGKVERHSGRPVELRPWERRWPWLAAPIVLWRLWRERRLR